MSIELNDLLGKVGLDPPDVMVMRHQPTDKRLRRVLPWFAQDRPDVYNAYQSQHGPRVEQSLARRKYLVSSIGFGPAKALFVGIYDIAGCQKITRKQFLASPTNLELSAYGTRGPARGQNPLWFDLRLTPLLSPYKGRMELHWPGIERSWWRLAEKNKFAVSAIHGENRLAQDMPDWRDLTLTWQELKALPRSWEERLAEWRGIYFIFDTVARLGYVGAAYGKENLLGRWRNYAGSGHGGNRWLRAHNPGNFQFSILERVSPDMEAEQIQDLEAQWKKRLHTRHPLGLNDN